MGTISVSLPSDGSTADASDVNTPINTIVNEINGNLDNANIKADAAIAGTKLADGAITNSKLSTTAGEVGGAWKAWTPTWTNLTVGNATVVARYTQIGKTIIAKVRITWGNTTSASGITTCSLPVTADSTIVGDIDASGTVRIRDDNAATKYNGVTKLASTTTVTFSVLNTTGPATTDVLHNAPFTWTTSDVLMATIIYEAA